MSDSKGARKRKYDTKGRHKPDMWILAWESEIKFFDAII